MHLNTHARFQTNDGWLRKLPAELLLAVAKRLLHESKELPDRLNQNPDNSTRPPTSQPPWAETGGSEEQSGGADERGPADSVAAAAAESSAEETAQTPPHRPMASSHRIGRLRRLCEAQQMDEHSVLPSVVREFIYDRSVILRPVAEPHLQLFQQPCGPGAAAPRDFAHHQPRHTLCRGVPCLRFPRKSPGKRSPPQSIRLAVPSAPSSPPLAKLLDPPAPRHPRHPCKWAGE